MSDPLISIEINNVFNYDRIIYLCIFKEPFMKKIMLAATLALCFAGSSIAETAGGDTASGFASGKLDKEMIAGGAAVALVILGMNSNNRGTLAPIVVIRPPIECGAGEELVDGVCVPITTTTTVTTTVTTTNTVNSTITTPVTVSTTSL